MNVSTSHECKTAAVDVSLDQRKGLWKLYDCGTMKQYQKPLGNLESLPKKDMGSTEIIQELKLGSLVSLKILKWM